MLSKSNGFLVESVVIMPQWCAQDAMRASGLVANARFRLFAGGKEEVGHDLGLHEHLWQYCLISSQTKISAA